MKVLHPQYIWVVTPKNEGFGFPWHLLFRITPHLFPPWRMLPFWVRGPTGPKNRSFRGPASAGPGALACSSEEVKCSQRSSWLGRFYHGNPKPSFLGVTSPIYWGVKTFIFPWVVGVQGYWVYEPLRNWG